MTQAEIWDGDATVGWIPGNQKLYRTAILRNFLFLLHFH
jgi:hypothetical protein